MVIFLYGRRPYGRVEVSGGTFVLTDFFHLWYLPLAPTGSHLILSRDETGLCQNVPIRMHGASVLAAYLRTWGALAALGCLFAMTGALHDGRPAALPLLVAAAALGGAVAWSWMRLGKLSTDALARQAAYARFAGYPVDVARLGSRGDALTSQLRDRVSSEARGLMSGSYRSALDPETQWAEIALDPTVQAREFLEACLTLARLEWTRSAAADRARLDDLHTHIWRKLTTLHTPADP